MSGDSPPSQSRSDSLNHTCMPLIWGPYRMKLIDDRERSALVMLENLLDVF